MPVRNRWVREGEIEIPRTATVESALRESTAWRALALLLASPSDSRAEEAARLGDSLPAPFGPVIADLARQLGHDAESTYHELMGPGAPCPTGESDWAASAMVAKGGLLGDVGAFYRAFAFDPSRELREAPDHVAAELSFVAWLHMKEAFAVSAEDAAAARICAEARHAFLEQHLLPFLEPFLERLEQRAGATVYGAVARLCREVTLGALASA